MSRGLGDVYKRQIQEQAIRTKSNNNLKGNLSEVRLAVAEESMGGSLSQREVFTCNYGYMVVYVQEVVFRVCWIFRMISKLTVAFVIQII